MLNRRTLFKTSAIVGTLFGAKATLASEVKVPADYTTKVVGTKENPLPLNFNENNLGLSKKAEKAAVEAIVKTGNRYPFETVDAAKAQIAQKFGFKPENLVLGNGSSECIQAAIQAIAVKSQAEGKKCQFVQPVPTFGSAETYALGQKLPVVSIPVDKDTLAFNLEELKAQEHKFDGVTIYYLCNPNNPTGVITDKKVLKDWIQNSKAFFILDEAYAELVNDKNYESGFNYVKAGFDNVVVLRTFSKLYAMAGLRLGYAVATEKTINDLFPLIAIDNVNAAAAVAASASLADTDYINLSLAAFDLSKKIVEKCFKDLGVAYMPCNANFIFHKISVSGNAYRAAMAEHGCTVGRDFPPLDGWNRLSLGTPGQMKYFVEVFTKLKKEGKA